MPAPLAYFLTWTTYGTRMHGDDRGSVDVLHNTPGTPLLPPDPELERAARMSLVYEPIVLSNQMRDVVSCAIRDHARIRCWKELALNVRTNHVHVVVDCRGAAMRSPERVMEEFKYWGTRRLRASNLVRSAGRIWTDHGSTRWINNAEGLSEAINYVLNLQ
jgi:hypothetical protein